MQILKEKLNKQTLRKNAIQKRDFMAQIGLIKKLSNSITKKILNSSDYKNAKNIALYFPIKNEIDITKIITNKKNFYLPKCTNLKMSFHKVTSLTNLKTGAFNIPEAYGYEIEAKNLDVIYIPALLANKKCYRLGYGKGFYDRFFAENYTKAKKIIVLPQNFISEDFVEDEFDIQCDEIIF